MNNPARKNGWSRVAAATVGLFATGFSIGCASQPIVTKTIYEDRSAWIRLEINPYTDDAPAAISDNAPTVSSGILKALLKGFRAEKDYSPGLFSYLAGKSDYNSAFVDPELMVLGPQLAKGLTMATPGERVAWCLTADYSSDERFITTGWAYLKNPYLHFRLVEWRTPVRVKSPAVPTSEACLVKPIPGTKASDRFFKLDYTPKTLIVTQGPMGQVIFNSRGEVMFKLAEAALAYPDQPSRSRSQGNGTVNSPPGSDTSVQPVEAASAKVQDRLAPPASAQVRQPKLPKEVTRQPQNHAKPKAFDGAASAGGAIP